MLEYLKGEWLRCDDVSNTTWSQFVGAVTTDDAVRAMPMGDAIRILLIDNAVVIIQLSDAVRGTYWHSTSEA
jgi:hypothetical protein